MLLSNSFFGMDDPAHRPPNVVMTGPLLDVEQAPKNVSEVDSKLGEWLSRAEAKNQEVIYVSLGSEVGQ